MFAIRQMTDADLGNVLALRRIGKPRITTESMAESENPSRWQGVLASGLAISAAFGPSKTRESSIWDRRCRRPLAVYPVLFGERAAPLHLLHLAPDGVCLASDITAAAGAPLPHPFTLASSMKMQSALCCTCRQVALPGR